MLPEMRYIENELLPMLREERSGRFQQNIQKQLRQWRREPGVCSYFLRVSNAPGQDRLPIYDYKEIHYDPEKMFVNELRAALSVAFSNGDAVPSVRANMGTGILNTLYGGLKQELFTDKMPWLIKHLSVEELEEISLESLEESPEFKTGLEHMRFMKEMLQGTGISVYQMDLQSPIDMAHLFMGNEFFYMLYDDPELAHKVLEMSLRAGIYGVEKAFEIIEPNDDYICIDAELVLPAERAIRVSEDTSTLLCAEHLQEFMKPYTERLLGYFGGGMIHYCGNNEHLLEQILRLERCMGLNFGNPERHDPGEVLKSLAETGKVYWGRFPGMTAAEQAEMARQEDGWYNTFITGWCRWEEQEKVLEEFYQSIE